MNYSRETSNLLRKRLKKQKRKTFILFLVGLIMGGAATFSAFYWYPVLKKEFNLPELKQYNTPTSTTKSSQTKQSTQESTKQSSQESNSTNSKNNDFVPRVHTNNFVKTTPQYEKLAENINQKIKNSNTAGTFLVVKNNQIVNFENYGNEIESSTNPMETTYMLGSVQKLVTSILLAKLIENNEISLDTSLATYYPEIPNSKNITIDQMLSMTSGLFLEKKLKDTKSKEESINYVLNNVQYQPQTTWRYSDVNFFLLATIIEKITRTSYEEFFKETIKQPLNLEHTGFYNEVTPSTHLMPSYYRDDNGKINKEPVKISTSFYINELGTGNIYTCPSDLLTLIQAVIDGKIISFPTLQNILERRPANYNYIYKAGLYDKDTYYYSHGIFRGYEPTLLFSKDGNNAVIFLSNTYNKDKSNVELSKEIFNLVNEPQKNSNQGN